MNLEWLNRSWEMQMDHLPTTCPCCKGIFEKPFEWKIGRQEAFCCGVKMLAYEEKTLDAKLSGFRLYWQMK